MNTSHSSEERSRLEKASKQHLLVWGALTASVLGYAAVAILLVGSEPANPEAVEMYRTILGAVSLFTIFAGTFLRRKMLSSKKPLTPNPEAVFQRALSRYSLWSLVSWAAAESAVIFGLVLFLWGGRLEDLLAFGGLSLVALFYNKPSAEALDDYIFAQKKLLKG